MCSFGNKATQANEASRLALVVSKPDPTLPLPV
jgi:hypothetical protein